ncbi:MAG: ester cyclase [Verrucomicrobia bacterium]|nr:ester cyclase [Verrucomicrobiota bacterium]
MKLADTPPTHRLPEGEIRSIETLYKAFNERNPDLLDQACAPDWEDIPMGPGQAPGPDGLKQLLPGFFQALPDLQIIIHEIIGIPGRAGVRASIVGTHRGEILGIKPTGKSVEVSLHEFHHLRDGRIIRTWHLEDWFGLLQQLNAWPPGK